MDHCSCLKWHEKKDVTILTTIHEAVFVETGKVDREGNKLKNLKLFFFTVHEWEE